MGSELAIELDDVTRESSLHPGVAVIPAALALAQERRSAPTAFLEAVVAGYETTMRVGNALGAASAYARGCHPTGVAGVFGAAVAAGRLSGLDAGGLVRALGIAGTMASGSLEYLADGAWTKRLNAGWAAHAGIVAAGLAAAGFTGPATALDGRFGVLHAYTDAPLPEELTARLGDPLMVLKVTIKPYACCRYTHPLIDGVLALRAEHGITPEDVAAIRLGVLSAGAALIAEPIARMYDAPVLAPVVRWLSAVLPLRALATVPVGLLQRRFLFRALAIRSIAGAMAGGVAGVAAALSGWGVYALVAQQLVAAGENVIDVPPVRASRVRVLGSGRSQKNDPNDARSIAIAALRADDLATVCADDHSRVLKLLSKRHRDLGRLKNKSCCRLHSTASAPRWQHR